MTRTLPLTTIIDTWQKALAESTEINDFCLEKYSKKPKIFVGINRKKPPTEDDCPYIVIRPGVKEEGELDSYSYVISVGWAIKNGKETQIGSVIAQDGVSESDDLGQMIYELLFDVSQYSPITLCQYELEPIEFWPQFVGEMALEIQITPTIGGQINY